MTRSEALSEQAHLASPVRAPMPPGIPATDEAAEVWNAIAPWVSEIFDEESPAWTEGIETQKRKLRRVWFQTGLERLWRALPRSQKQVEAVYSARWDRDRFTPFEVPQSPPRGGLWGWHDLRFRMHATGGRRARIVLLMRLIEQLRPRSVLEVGFGEGLNLALLAAQFPSIRFAGVELTEGGHGAAMSLAAESRLPRTLEIFSPRPVVDSAAHRGLELHRGSAAALPFADRSFDLVFTSLALEQMAAVQDAALREIRRVAARHMAFIEPFGDFNAEGLRRSYVRRMGYFALPVAKLARYGIALREVNDRVPYKVQLRPALVIAEPQGVN